MSPRRGGKALDCAAVSMAQRRRKRSPPRMAASTASAPATRARLAFFIPRRGLSLPHVKLLRPHAPPVKHSSAQLAISELLLSTQSPTHAPDPSLPFFLLPLTPLDRFHHSPPAAASPSASCSSKLYCTGGETGGGVGEVGLIANWGGGVGDVRLAGAQGPQPASSPAASDELPGPAALQVCAEHAARRGDVRGSGLHRGGGRSRARRRPRRRGQRPRPLPRRAPRRDPRLQASPPRPLHGGRRVHGRLPAAHVPVAAAAADGSHGGRAALQQRQLRRHGAHRRRQQPAPPEQLPRRLPEPSQHGQRVREHAPGGHGRRRRVQERRLRRAAEGAAQLLVPVPPGVGDVADLRGGQRGARRRQQPRGRRQRRRHPGRVRHGRRRRRFVVGRLDDGRGVAADVIRREAPPRLRRRRAAERGAAAADAADAGAAAQPARRRRRREGGDGGDREVPAVLGRRPLQDPRQARVRHAPPQHRRAGEEDEDQRADTEAAGARAQLGKANQHCRNVGSGRGLHQGSSEASQGAERRPRQLHLLRRQAPAQPVRQLKKKKKGAAAFPRCDPARHGRKACLVRPFPSVLPGYP